MTPDTSIRRYEFDWLRILAILVVFLYHSTRFFNLGDWHVKNAHTYIGAEIWISFASTWLMPLFFIISGASLFYAIGQSESWKKFYVNKFMRLMVPVLVATITHSVLQVYLERLSHGHFQGSFVSFLPAYFNGIYLGIGIPEGNFSFAGMHLWFLLFLFLDSLICYRLFIWLKGSGQRMLYRTTTLFTMPGLMYVWFSLPLMAMYALIPPAVLNAGAGAWGFLYYLWFLIAGFMIVSNDRLQKTIKDQRWVSLLLGIMLSTISLYQSLGPSRMVLPELHGNWIHVLIYFISAWCWLLAILGFGMRHLAFNRPTLSAANEGVLPFYILHQPVLLSIGYFVVTWEIPDGLKWVIIATSSFVVILMLYLFLVRKIDLLRFLFGMKTIHPLWDPILRRRTLIAAHAFFLGLIVFSVSGVAVNHSPMSLQYDPANDILLNSTSISDRSPTGVRVVNDKEASIGQAIEFYSGANRTAEPNPTVFVEIHFSAPAGRYWIWLRGKSGVNNLADSVWLQVDDWIGTRTGDQRMGNWLDIHPASVYAWAGDGDTPIAIELKHTGDHTIRIQPRQTPHRIDQIWLSHGQRRIPNIPDPIRE